MSQGRIKLLLAGIASLLLLSSFSVWRIFRDGNRIEASAEEYKSQQVSREIIQDLVLLITESKHLTTSWVFLPEHVEGKVKLRQLQTMTFPEIKKRLTLGDSATVQNNLPEILKEMAALIEKQVSVTAKLATAEDYKNDGNLKAAKQILTTDVIPASDAILVDLDLLENTLDREISHAWIKSKTEVESADEVSLLLSILMFTSGVIGLIIILSAKRP